MLIILAAKIVKIAVPTTYKAVGNVASDFIEAICDPIIPLKKTVIVAAVNPKTWLMVNKLRFLGFGWNFLFISGTSLVVLTYKEEEKFRVQGINDLIVFSTMALASLSAGLLLSLTSWATMNLICIPFLILILITTYRAERINWNNSSV